MASVGTLASGVAHEINNPLASVAANIELLVDELEALGAGPSSARLAESRAMALDAQAGAERIRKIVPEPQDLLAGGDGTSGPSRGAPGPGARRQPGRQRDPTPRAARGGLRADAARPRRRSPLSAQVFINLLVNAAQALPEGRRDAHEIRIVTSTDASGARRDRDPRYADRASPRPSSIGSSIPSSRPSGWGSATPDSGLSVCHNLVTAMGGEITVSSGEGRGAIFRVVLPAAAAVEEAAPASAGSPSETERTRLHPRGGRRSRGRDRPAVACCAITRCAP